MNIGCESGVWFFFFFLLSAIGLDIWVRNGSVNPWVFCLGIIYNYKIICHIILKHATSFFC
jgi:hypothetical protein